MTTLRHLRQPRRTTNGQSALALRLLRRWRDKHDGLGALLIKARPPFSADKRHFLPE
jgi:hypothetical protein